MGTTEPKRIQLKRTKGWRIPPNTVVVSRPTKWGNPFTLGDAPPYVFSEEQRLLIILDMYRGWLAAKMRSGELNPVELKGKNLACWCGPNQKCHADILLRVANDPKFSDISLVSDWLSDWFELDGVLQEETE